MAHSRASPYAFPQPHLPVTPPFETRNLKHLHAPHPNLIEDVYGAEKKPRTFKQWEDAAKQSTQDLKLYGSLSPIVWVHVKGKDIPPNAIVAGEERRQPLYIARTFYEGGICIGKAGHHLDQGASFAYNGHEIHVASYEVLVPALQPLRYALSDPTVHMPKISRLFVEKKDERGLERLNMIKTVVLIDDSASMAGPLWREAREALAGITEINGSLSNDGVDLYFMNDTRFAVNIKDGNEVRRLFDSVKPIGETPTGRKLHELFDIYLPIIEDRNSQHRPITLVVITDGVPTDDPAEVIIESARRLDQLQVPLKQFRIQFAQIGDDPEATEALEELDNDIFKPYGVRDIVDATLYNPSDRLFTSETMVKILLGAIDNHFDGGSSPHLGLHPFNQVATV